MDELGALAGSELGASEKGFGGKRARREALAQSAALNVLVAFACGNAGGVANALMAFALWAVRLQEALNVETDGLGPVPYEPCWLYNKMVWGGFWAVLLIALVPWRRGPLWARAAGWGLLISTVHCAIVFPAQGNGAFGADYGRYTPVLVYVEDAAYAQTAAYLYQWVTCSAPASERTMSVVLASPLLSR